jgi:hypothetical protein
VLLVATVARADNEKLAKHLHKLNPAALVDGESIVGTKPGETLHGVHGKPNFIIALGDDETIHGASHNDELGAIGNDVTILPSSHGHTLIVGGPHSKIVVTGEGHNLIFSHAKGATITLESPADEVIANGPHDKILCAKHSSQELIEVAKGDKVSKSCKGHHDQIEPAPALSLSAHSSAARAHASAECNLGSVGDCTVRSFTHTLDGLWVADTVPSTRCFPGVLVNQNYAPFGTTVIPGIEVEGLGPIGVNISTPFRDPSEGNRVVGNDGGSATNWVTGSASYTLILHCTTDLARGYF